MARKNGRHLVTQFIENIPSKAIENYEHLLRSYIHRRHGIYALYKKNKLYYVGLASKLKGRLKAHLRDRHSKKWDSFSIYLTLDIHHIKELETLVLRITDPKGNKKKGRFPHAQNLINEFRADIKNEFNNQLKYLVGGIKPIKSKKVKKITKNSPILGQYNFKNAQLQGVYKGKLYKARVTKDGSIRFKNKTYNSPSLAGIAARKRNTNGWTFWKYQRAPGDWIHIDNIRR
jgi:hypothetical protein